MAILWELMKSKNFLILVLFILATSISIWLVSVPTPNFREIMTQTHKQIKNLKHINVISPKKEVGISVDDTYLELLGFNMNQDLYPKLPEDSVNPPVVVTGAMSPFADLNQIYKLMESVRKYIGDRMLVIYDLGLNSVQLVQLKKHCNDSMNCTVRPLDLNKFPDHVRNPNLKAYIPITIQRALSDYGAVIWTDTLEYFITSEIQDVLKQAEKFGIAAWPLKSNEPTSAFTHPKMFNYFHTQSNKFYFHKMVGTNHLVIYNTKNIHNRLMRLWVKCVLMLQCIYPYGAQSRGCSVNRKPLYRYSRCHRFEVSALNVILGLEFDFDDQKYLVQNEIFGIEPENDDELEQRKSTKLAPTEHHRHSKQVI